MLLLVAGVISAKAQAFKFGTITADVGVGGGFYSVFGYSPINQENHSGIGVIGSLPSVNAEFGLVRFLGAGIRYRGGTYGKSEGNKLRGTDLMLLASFHLANRNKKFDLPIGVGYGYSTFGGDLSATEFMHTKGTVMNLHISPHIYFGEYVGMFFGLGYNKHLLSDHIEMQDTNGNLYTEADGATWNMEGLYFEFGIAGRLRILKGKNE